MSCGQWDELLPCLDRIARAFGDLQCTRHRVENQALAAKLACYLGQLEEAHKRFSAMTDEAHALAGGMGELWGLLGQVETGMRLGRYSPQELHALLERARRDMTEIENVDSAYNLRWLGLKAMVAWRSGQIEVARETALIAAAVARRIRFCGFWAHEGFAGPIEVLLRVRAQERQLGGASPVLDEALACLMRAMRAHVRRFPPGAARLHQLRGLAAIDAGHLARAVAALRESVSAAERYGLRYELARSCELLAHIDCKGTWKQRAQRLFSEVGADDDLRRLLDREPATVVPSSLATERDERWVSPVSRPPTRSVDADECKV